MRYTPPRVSPSFRYFISHLFKAGRSMVGTIDQAIFTLQEIRKMKIARTRRNTFYQAGAFLLAATLYLVPVSTFASGPAPIYTPSAKFDRAWVDYGVTQGGKLGMTIHT